MITLFHHPFCPHSRFARTVLGEYGMPARLVEERVWERREAFLVLNPAGTTPVLVEEGHPAVPGRCVGTKELVLNVSWEDMRVQPRFFRFGS